MTKMTIMTIKTNNREWPLAVAKARLSEVVEQARSNGPQTLTRRGRRAAIVVSIDEWDRRIQRQGNLAEFLLASPLRGSRLEVPVLKERPRRIKL